MFVIQRPQHFRLHVGLVGARRRRRAADRERLGARLRLQVNAAWRSTALDRTLADGVAPATTAVLALRAQKLTGTRGRDRVAKGLASAVRTATDTRPGFTSALRPRASELLEAQTVLTALERRLHDTVPVSAQGVAMLGTLLTDAAGPLYQPGRPGELAGRLRAAAAALDHSYRAGRALGDWPVTGQEASR